MFFFESLNTGSHFNVHSVYILVPFCNHAKTSWETISPANRPQEKAQ